MGVDGSDKKGHQKSAKSNHVGFLNLFCDSNGRRRGSEKQESFLTEISKSATNYRDI